MGYIARIDTCRGKTAAGSVRRGLLALLLGLSPLAATAQSGPIFCLGRPIQPLVFADPVVESTGASIATPEVGDVFRFLNVAPGVDALVEVVSFNNGASLAGIDNDGSPTAPIGVPDNLQPTLVGPAGDISVDLQITIVTTGTSIPQAMDFAGSAIDVDGNSAGLREYIEVSDNVVEFAVNGVPVASDPTGPATRLITQANTPPDTGASAPSSSSRIRFEAETDDTAAGIDPNEPRNIAAAFFTDVSVFEYRIGKFGGATAGRLNSLAFNCPAIDPGSGGTALLIDEDFGDAPFDAFTNPGYGNPIHVIDSANPIVQIGAINTADTAAGNSPTANSDVGDDGVTLSGANLQGQSLQGLEPVEVTIDVFNGSPSPGMLQAFFDWNIDGDFTDPGEQVATNVQDTDNDGTITLNITPPVDTVAGTSFARFRWSTSVVGFQDPAGDGEVEDYQVTLQTVAPADLSLTLNASNSAPGIGQTITLILEVTNDGPAEASGVVVSLPLPAGLTFVSSDGGPAYDPVSGEWTLPAPLASGESVSLNIEVSTASLGTSAVVAEIVSAARPDTDSTPANAGTEPGEDDTDSVDVMVVDNPVTCPAGFNLSAMSGTAVAVEFEERIGNSDRALGALSPEGTSPPNAVAAFVNIGAESLLVVDLGVIVPENAQLLFSLARDGGNQGDNTRLEIRTSTDPDNFPDRLAVYGVSGPTTLFSAAQDTLERFFVAVPAGGARYVRFDILNGDNGFVDGISYDQICTANGELQGVKTVQVFDPDNEGLFAVPGNDVTYTITVTNSGDVATGNDSVSLIDQLPTEVTFFNGDADGPGPGTDPVNFSEIVTTGLAPFVFADDVGFSDQSTRPADFASCDYDPVSGFDPAVTFICFNPKGVFEAGDPNPSFSVSFRARIR